MSQITVSLTCVLRLKAETSEQYYILLFCDAV